MAGIGELEQTQQGQPDGSVRASVMAEARSIAGQPPKPALRSLVCPYCGIITPDSGRCSGCQGRFDPLSRQATQNQMGAWSIRDDRQPFRPGCTYQTIVRLIEQQKITQDTVLRGPSTRQFWTLARHTPGVSQLLGVCHSCQHEVKPDAFSCPSCHAAFTIERDRQHLGLGPSRPLPGQGLPEVLALQAEPAHQSSQSGQLGKAGVQSVAVASEVPAGEPISDRISSGAGNKQAIEAAQLARRWKAAWASERRRAWIAIGVSLVIVVAALGYAVLAGIEQSGL
tara:strand:+ start:86388 stop:87236 length:849 start_codon:yes stop_codon:yes gene_type:complete